MDEDRIRGENRRVGESMGVKGGEMVRGRDVTFTNSVIYIECVKS